MLELVVALLIGTIAVGIVLAMGRDARGGRYPSRPRGRGRGVPVEQRHAAVDSRDEWVDEEYEVPYEAPRRRARELAGAAPADAADRGGGRSWLILVWAGLGVFAAVLFVAAARSGGGGSAKDDGVGSAGEPAPSVTSTKEATTPSRTPTGTPTAAGTRTPTSTPAPPNAATLAVQARQSANVRVTVDGRIDYDGALRAGETRTWAGSSNVELWTDNGKNVSVMVNGFDLGALSTAVGHPEWNTVDWSWAAGWHP